MAIQWGKSPLHRIKSFRARNWFPAEFIKFGTKVADYYQDRCEVVYGLLGDVSGTTVSLSACGVNLSVGEAVLNGRHYAITAESDTDVFTTAGQVGQAIYSDGADASGFAHTGSSSETALNKHYGGHADYRSSEGKKVQLKYRGKIKETVLNILGGLRSSCTYVGAPSLKQLSKCTTFVRVNQQYNDTFE